MKFQLHCLLLNILLLGCISESKVSSHIYDGFPDIWWQEIPNDQVANWEIPPQAADRTKSEVVLSKRNELGQFSNLQAAQFYLDGDFYASVEGFWQSLKYPENSNDERLKEASIVWPYTREKVMKLSGFDAKKAGDAANIIMKKLDIKWVTYKGKKINYSDKDLDTVQHYDLIVRACRAKLSSNPHLIALLERTRTLKLLSDHRQKPGAPPSYRYHEIYMRLRDELAQSH